MAAVPWLARAEDPFMPSLDAAGAPPPGYALALGRAVLVEDGEEKTFGLFRELMLYVTSLETGQTERVRFLGEGEFAWALKPGPYVVASFGYNRLRGRIWTAFDVPEPGRAAYIGDLVLGIDTKTQRYGVAITDRYEARLAQEAGRLAAAKLEPARALMRPEERVGRYQRIGGICAAYWQLECSRTYQGVEPLQPQGTHDGFPVVAGAPLLEWKPAKAEGITYDVAVYEALVLSGVAGLPGARYERGRLVAYAENLAEPRYALAEPLRPGRRYFWSVRLRREDAVSTWSTTSYFVFFLVGAASGSGGWFGFATPSP